MDPFHERLARVGLAAVERYGFALAGGYAVQAAGMLMRPSEDIDLFTAWERRAEFADAVSAVVAAYRAERLSAEIDHQHDGFVRLTVSDGERSSKVELAVDTRANEPIQMTIGPVLHPDDAVTNKMTALYTRAFARDFIDIDATLQSGRYDREALLALAERAEIGFDRQVFAQALDQVELLDRDDFAVYGVTGPDLDDLRTRFRAWRQELTGGTEPRASHA
ncbi:MAG TPA: nucleotidyl transferase AbiEii/AbiGii toxin family protein [Micromonosporaceae bacterium]